MHWSTFDFHNSQDAKLSLVNLVHMAMSSTTNFTLDDSDIGDACLFALVEAKMKDMAQVVEALR